MGNVGIPVAYETYGLIICLFFSEHVYPEKDPCGWAMWARSEQKLSAIYTLSYC